MPLPVNRVSGRKYIHIVSDPEFSFQYIVLKIFFKKIKNNEIVP
jgi:hypothetical protein